MATAIRFIRHADISLHNRASSSANKRSASKQQTVVLLALNAASQRMIHKTLRSLSSQHFATGGEGNNGKGREREDLARVQ